MTAPQESGIQCFQMPLWERHTNLFRSQSTHGLRSENIGGLVSLIGSAMFLFGGDPNGIFATSIFLAAEVLLTRYGHSREGYSAGCFLLASGDLLAANSLIAAGNRPFEVALVAMAAVWLVGALRYPLTLYGQRAQEIGLVKFGDRLQPIVGTAILALRVPGIVVAAAGLNYPGTTAIACWAAADILLGRLHHFSLSAFRNLPN
jgi:hypothetical protein